MEDNLIVLKSKAFALRIIKLYQHLQDRGERIMSKQLLRSGTSVGANIAEGQYAQSKADFITLSAGANDVLKHVNRSQSGEFSFDLPAVLKAVQEVVANYEKIFAEIQKINPEVDVVIMGLYNPFPYRQDAALQIQLNTLVATMNNSIKAVVEKNGGVFSDVADTVAKDYVTYLPNPNNIHLGKAGYEVVAEKMLSDYMAVVLNNVEDELNDTGNIVFDNFSDTENHWAREYINKAYINGILKGYDDGTFKPNVNMTRVQVVSVLTRAFDLHATSKRMYTNGHHGQVIQHYGQCQGESARFH